MTKAKAQKDESMSLATAALLSLVVIGLAGAAKEGAFSGIGKHGHGPKRHGTFEVAVEWHSIPGGVRIDVTRNGTPVIAPSPRRVPAATPSQPPVFHFPGWSTDKVVVRVRELNPSADPDPTGYLFASILFKGDDGNISLPEFGRDTSPVDLNGLRVEW